MKRFLCLLMVAIVPYSACGAWGKTNGEPVLSYVSDIVLADFESTEVEDEITYGSFKIAELLKGRASGMIKVSENGGPEIELKKMKKGRYLLIIDQMGTVYWPGNGAFSAIPVVGGKVMWPQKMENGVEMVPTDLKKVKAEIAVIAAAEKAAFEKGVKKAKADLEDGKINYRYKTSVYSNDVDRIVAERAKKKYGINLEFYSGFIFGVEKHFHRGHQKTVIEFLEKKHGFDPVEHSKAPWKPIKKK